MRPVSDPEFQITKLPDGIEYIRKMEEKERSSPCPDVDDIRSIQSDDAENFTDPTFESELAEFRSRMHMLNAEEFA